MCGKRLNGFYDRLRLYSLVVIPNFLFFGSFTFREQKNAIFCSQYSLPLYDYDGGHGMIFRSFTGQYYLVLHYPNKFGKEHPVFMPLNYENGKFR